MSYRKTWAAGLVLAAGAAGCTLTDDHHAYFHKEEQPHAVEWGYVGKIGPSHWGDLSPDFVLAKTGRQQSPIDLVGAVGQKLPPIEFHYAPAKINLVYNGHTIEEKQDQTSFIEVSGTRYQLQQFHFHSPSEHLLEGKHTEMEMHLVHKSADGETAVVAVMIEPGEENSGFAPVWNCLPTEDHSTRQSNATVDTDQLLPKERGYYRYMGSFTTPPCTEDVLWMVLPAPVTLSRAQIEEFRAIIHGNNRPVQPLNGRQISRSP
jgi:carbonic anhydrase